MAPRLSLTSQHASLRADWPAFDLIYSDHRIAIWRGWITAFSRPYLIEIRYVFNDPFEPFPVQGAGWPEVRVLEPLLKRGPLGEEIPHIYVDPEDPVYPVLCLFDPRIGGWSRSQTISETTLPWAASWLRFYELWRATGEWYGGGADHPSGAANDAGLPDMVMEAAPVTQGSATPQSRVAREAGYRPAAAAFWRQWGPIPHEPMGLLHAA